MLNLNEQVFRSENHIVDSVCAADLCYIDRGGDVCISLSAQSPQANNTGTDARNSTGSNSTTTISGNANATTSTADSTNSSQASSGGNNNTMMARRPSPANDTATGTDNNTQGANMTAIGEASGHARIHTFKRGATL